MSNGTKQQTTNGDPYMPDHRLEFVPSPRWVRVKFAGETIASSKRALLLRETGHLPVYYFPPDDVNRDFLEATDHTSHCRHKGDASYWSVKVGHAVADNAVWAYNNPISSAKDLAGHKAFYWHKMDAWYEEEEEIFVHPPRPLQAG